jgi:hypothetical protein
MYNDMIACTSPVACCPSPTLHLFLLSRSLSHYTQCVDEWLRVNATCPTCRNSIIAGNNGTDGSNGGDSNSDGTNSNRAHSSGRTDEETGATVNPGTSLTLGNAYSLVAGNDTSSSTASGAGSTVVRRNGDSGGATNRSGHRVITLNFQLERR